MLFNAYKLNRVGDMPVPTVTVEFQRQRQVVSGLEVFEECKIDFQNNSFWSQSRL